METRDAIRERRAVRDYSDEPLSESVVRELIDAAILAPSAVNVQPWSFVVIQDRDLMKRISDRAKLLLMHSGLPEGLMQMISDPGFNIFYNSGTLIVICAKPEGEHADWDCCLAGENLMIAARDMGLGSCVIGFAWAALALPEVRNELGIPAGYQAVLPIIVGRPKAFPTMPPRDAPVFLSWKPGPVTAASS